MTGEGHVCDVRTAAGGLTTCFWLCGCGRVWELLVPEVGPVPPSGAAWFDVTTTAGEAGSAGTSVLGESL